MAGDRDADLEWLYQLADGLRMKAGVAKLSAQMSSPSSPGLARGHQRARLSAQRARLSLRHSRPREPVNGRYDNKRD